MHEPRWGADAGTCDCYALADAEVIITIRRGADGQLAPNVSDALIRLIDQVTGAGVLWRGGGEAGTLAELRASWHTRHEERRFYSASATPVGVAAPAASVELIVSGPDALRAALTDPVLRASEAHRCDRLPAPLG